MACIVPWQEVITNSDLDIVNSKMFNSIIKFFSEGYNSWQFIASRNYVEAT